jgi:CCR4-NOT transcription complex subunit 1
MQKYKPKMDEKTVHAQSLKQMIDRMYPQSINKATLTNSLQIIKKHRKISLREVADLILFIADTSHRQWNIETILNCLNDVFDSINWRGVYEKFLEDDLKIWNTEYLYTLVDCWVHISGIITVPYEVFFRKWISRENQIGFLKILLESDEKRTQVYSNIFFEKIVTKEELRNTKYKKSIEYESNLNSIELFKSIKDIESVETIDLIKDKSPEYCILGLAAINYNANPFCDDIFDDLLVHFSEGSSSNFVFYILFSKYKDYMLMAFKRISDRISLTRTLDMLLEHKMLPIVTEVLEPKDLCYDIIILSSRRDHLNLEIWLNNNIKAHSESFISYLFSKLLCSEGTSNDLVLFSLKSDSEIFPFNKNIIGSVIKILENNYKDLSEESINKIEEIKSKISDLKVFDKPCTSDRATAFISEIINSHVEVEDSIFKLKELIKGDESSNIFVKKVFGLLIDNYSSLYKLPNSDMLAVFFGELIKRRIFLKPFMKVALQLIKNSLKFPENDREYAFAFRILEIFFNEFPEFFIEIENIENVRIGLIKKELVLVDEDTQSYLDIDGFLSHIFGKENDISKVGEYIQSFLSRSTHFSGISPAENISDKLLNISLNSKNGAISAEGSVPVLNASQIAQYIYKNIATYKSELFVTFCLLQNEQFKKYIIEKGFEILKSFFINKIESEIEYSKAIGSFLGKLVLAENKPVNLDLFDFRNFVLKSIEYRRITVCVYSVVNFLKEGKNGLIYVPNNPWLMSILELLSELHSCTLIHIREHIQELFKHFNIKINTKPSYRMKEHLVKYSIEYEGVLRQVISAALDFSVREICNKIVKSSIAVSKNTSLYLFNTVNSSNKYFLFRNLLVNLVRALIHISAQEPLKASICGNITHFLKLSMNDLPLDEVYRIATSNLKICCSLIEKVGITQVNEIASNLFQEMINKPNRQRIDIKSNSSLEISREGKNATENKKTAEISAEKSKEPVKQECSNINLSILTEAYFVEKTNIRSIENSEYQEIRSFLIQIGRKMPLKKKDYISEEWPLLLNSSKHSNFTRMIKHLETSPEKDDQCISLCKYLVGHAIKNNCKDDFIFEFISKILSLSHKTKKEVIGWLIYSEDSKKYNIALISKFIEYDLIYLEEYDQALASILKSDESKSLPFIMDLLSNLMFKNIKLCTVYDFIHTIESLNKVNDNPKVFEFFKKIEIGIMKFGENISENNSVFDDFIEKTRFNISPDLYLNKFKEKYKLEQLNFKLALKSCWTHFVLFSGSYRFFKVDILSCLIKDNILFYLKESMSFLVQAYSKRQYLFFMFYCRFFVKVLDYIEDTHENRSTIWKILDILSPSNLPSFTAQFLEILDHPFISKFIENPDFFYIAADLLEVLKFNNKYEFIITQFFVAHNAQIKQYNLYFSYLCPQYAVNLKNLFNMSRTKLGIEKNSNSEKGTNPFFTSNFYLSKNIRVNSDFTILIDNLNEKNYAMNYAMEALRFMIDKNLNVREIVLLLMIRNRGSNVPYGIKHACDELLSREDLRGIVEEYENKFYNKL